MRVAALASLVVALVAACSSAAINNQAYREPCAGHACRIAVFNHSSADVSVRYADSTGRRELLGLVSAGGSARFSVQFIHSSGIRVFAMSKQYGLYAADVAIDRALPVTEVHYPDDFREVSDTSMPVPSTR